MDFKSTGEETGLSRLQDLISPISSDKLEILVREEDKGKYELPRPAHNFIPDWYSEADLHPSEDTPLQKSIRACMPAMEALTFGWIIPVPLNISIVQEENGARVEWADTKFEAMENHPKAQVGGERFPHNGEVLKFNLPYILRTPEGVSTLFMPPLNRVETRFRPFSGIVDTDEYVNEVNIPSLMLDTEWSGVVEAGTPLVQVVPFKRDEVVNKSETRTMTEQEREWADRTTDAVTASDAYYKEDVWESIDSSKETGCPLGFGGEDDG